MTKNPLPDPGTSITLKRAVSFLNDSLFAVYGILQLGDAQTALHVDSNKEVKTEIDNGLLFRVDGRGHLILRNGTLMNTNNVYGYSAPVRVNSGGQFDMVGGRISSNRTYQVREPWGRPSTAGGVFVQPGAKFNLSNGLIDNHISTTGGVTVGDLYGGCKDAVMQMTGGIIVNNKARSLYGLGERSKASLDQIFK